MTEEKVPPIVFIGLGNPGKKYVHTRHNLGFIVVEELGRQLDCLFKEDRQFCCRLAKSKIAGQEVYMLLPQTYMNLSGWSVRHYIDYYKLTARQIIVVCDDTALEFGQLRLRSQGSSGGHNGLRSLEEHLGTNEFIRLRMGVGSNGVEQPLADYVLSNFNADETAVLDEFVKRGVEALKMLTTEPITQVMSRVNTKLTL